ncbi:MAG: hypothetical protein U5N58_00740 [Actinomycetota bacterium]|nr:hypothetical protein [Actinomycetota bacterium]
MAEGRAYATHEGAETIITDLAKDLDKYSEDYKKIADKAWAEEYEPQEEEDKAV